MKSFTACSKNGWVFWLYANDQAERVALSASGVRWMSVNLSVRVNKDFPPQSFSSGHTKGLPIGIILSFVLLTSMKLPSLVVFFFFWSNFFHAFVLLWFGGCGLPSEGFIELRACPPLCHEMVEFQAKPRLIFCARRKETVVAFLASHSTFEIMFTAEEISVGLWGGGHTPDSQI